MQVPLLLLLNGPPGIGKSTLAQRFVDDHPLALVLDIDTIRTWFGSWEEHDESKRFARDLAWAIVRAQLSAGRDVVLPQLDLRTEFTEQMRSLAAECGAEFVEVVVLGEGAEAIERFQRRAAELLASGRKHPAALVAVDKQVEAVTFSLERLRERVRDESVPSIETREGAIDDAYRALLAILNR